MNELCFIVEHQNHKYDIITLAKVKLINRCSEIVLVEVNLPGYNMALSNIAGPDCRGIIVYIKESIIMQKSSSMLILKNRFGLLSNAMARSFYLDASTEAQTLL